MSDGKGSFWSRVVICIFAASVVAIAGHQMSVKYASKKLAKSPASKEELLDEFQGDIDVSKASVSPTYLEKFSRKASSSPVSEKDAPPDSGALRKLLNKLAP